MHRHSHAKAALKPALMITSAFLVAEFIGALYTNSLALLAARFAETVWDGWPPVHWLVQRVGDQYTYRWPVVASSVILGCLALAWFAKRGQVHLLRTDRPCGALGSRQELLA